LPRQINFLTLRADLLYASLREYLIELGAAFIRAKAEYFSFLAVMQ
jgi:hypothetical protein